MMKTHTILSLSFKILLLLLSIISLLYTNTSEILVWNYNLIPIGQSSATSTASAHHKSTLNFYERNVIRLHIWAKSCGTCVYVFYFTQLLISNSIHIVENEKIFFSLCKNSIPIVIPVIFSFSVHQLNDARLSSFFSYCDHCCNEHGSAYILQHTNFVTFS